MTNLPSEQTWLSLSGICDSLRLSSPKIRLLARKGCLAYIGKIGTPDVRFLDPSPEYKQQLLLAAAIHMKVFPVSPDLNARALLTRSECAQILGWSQRYAENYFQQHRIPSVRVNKALHLYSALDLREILLKRSKKVLCKQKAPFLLEELIAYFRTQLEEDISSLPSDAEFLADEKIQRRLSKIVNSSQKQDFASKVALAKRVVQILESVKK